MTAHYRPAFRVAQRRNRYGMNAVIHELNDPKPNPVPRGERRKVARKARS